MKIANDGFLDRLVHESGIYPGNGNIMTVRKDREISQGFVSPETEATAKQLNAMARTLYEKIESLDQMCIDRLGIDAFQSG